MKNFGYRFLFFSLIFYSCGPSAYLTAESTATCTDYYYNSIRNDHTSIWTYHLGSRTYTGSDRDLFGTIIGQAAYIKYYPKDPTAFIVIKSKPIFYTDEHTTVTNATVLRVSKKKNTFHISCS